MLYSFSQVKLREFDSFNPELGWELPPWDCWPQLNTNFNQFIGNVNSWMLIANLTLCHGSMSYAPNTKEDFFVIDPFNTISLLSIISLSLLMLVMIIKGTVHVEVNRFMGEKLWMKKVKVDKSVHSNNQRLICRRSHVIWGSAEEAFSMTKFVIKMTILCEIIIQMTTLFVIFDMFRTINSVLHLLNQCKQNVLQIIWIFKSCKIFMSGFTYSANGGTQERREVIALEMENNLKLHFKPKLSALLHWGKDQKEFNLLLHTFLGPLSFSHSLILLGHTWDWEILSGYGKAMVQFVAIVESHHVWKFEPSIIYQKPLQIDKSEWWVGKILELSKMSLDRGTFTDIMSNIISHIRYIETTWGSLTYHQNSSKFACSHFAGETLAEESLRRMTSFGQWYVENVSFHMLCCDGNDNVDYGFYLLFLSKP